MSHPTSPIPAAGGRMVRRSAASAAPLFAYGTLRVPEVLHCLLGRIPAMVPATARGWRITGLPGLVYPALVAATDGEVSGILITGLTTADWLVIDGYEDDLYDLALVALTDGTQSWAYTSWTQPTPNEDRTPWSLDDFLDRHLADYLAQCAAWRRTLRT